LADIDDLNYEKDDESEEEKDDGAPPEF